jgi:hypothetical protein
MVLAAIRLSSFYRLSEVKKIFLLPSCSVGSLV